MQDQTATVIIEQSVGPELAAALFEYAGNLEPEERQRFLDNLAGNPDTCRRAEEAISSMAMLIAGANVIDDEREFEERAENCFADALNESPSIFAMRAFYLDNQSKIDMQSVASVPPEVARRRLARWRDYLADLR
jgi:hypothetical protein